MNDNPASRKSIALRLGVILLVVAAVLASVCGFVVSETEQGIVLRFGKPARILTAPGYYFRWPAPVERVVRVDRRLQHADIRLSETLTQDRRNVIVPVFFVWRVSDPLRFHTSVQDVANATPKLDALVTSARNSVLGRHSFADLVSDGRNGASLPAIEQEMLSMANRDAADQLGIELMSVGISRILLPEANTQSVFLRMRAERKREATQYRAEGRAQATGMKAETDKETSRLLADAKRQAEEIRGQGEAEAASIYAKAHAQDPDFYRFLREMQSLRTIIDRNTTIVLDTSVAPLQWLKAVQGQPAPLPPAEPGKAPDKTPAPAPTPFIFTGDKTR